MHKFVSFDGNDAGQNKDYLQERFVSAKFSSDDENATLSFAKNFAKHLKFGDFLALFGELGVGKTIFVKGKEYCAQEFLAKNKMIRCFSLFQSEFSCFSMFKRP